MSSDMPTTLSTSTKFANEFLVANNAVLAKRQDNSRHLINSTLLEYNVILLYRLKRETFWFLRFYQQPLSILYLFMF